MSSDVAAVLDGSARWALLEADCRAVLRELPDASVDCVCTDPPFGIEHDSDREGSEWAGEIVGDSTVDGAWLAEAARVLRPGGALYAFTRWDVEPEWAELIRGTGLRVKQSLVWDRGTHGTGDLRGSYGPSHERVLFATKGRHILRGPRLPDVLRVPAICSREWRWHPHEKPVDLLALLVCASTDEGGLVVDPFAGSGSTLLAARQHNRRAVGTEIDPKWARWAHARLNGAQRREVDGPQRQLSLLGGSQ